jgi:hypothetical protein
VTFYHLLKKCFFFVFRFNYQKNYNYIGDAPAKEEFINFHDTKEQVHSKEKFYKSKLLKNNWCFKQELKKTIENEAKILSLSALHFVKMCFDFQIRLKQHLQILDDEYIHPFEKRLTSLSGYTFLVCNFYFLNNYDFFAVNYEYTGKSTNCSKPELEVSLFYEFFEPQNCWRHNFNHPDGQKSFKNHKVDLYSPVLKKVIQMHGCDSHYHVGKDCTINSTKTDESLNSKKIPYANLKIRDEKIKTYLLENFANEIQAYEVIYQCQWQTFKKHDSNYFVYKLVTNLEKEKRPLHRLVPRSTVRAGLSDVYYLRWEKDQFPNEKFYYSDVQGLYSFAAIKYPYPVGKYEIFVGCDITKDITFENDGFHYYKGKKLICGAAQVRVRPPTNLKHPFLQYRIYDKFNFLTLCKLCAIKKSKRCLHKKTNVLESSWMFSDLRKAVKLGYTIEAWHEIHYFPHTDYILKDYSIYLYSEKIKYSGWPQPNMTLSEKENYCRLINTAMEIPLEFQLNPSNVCKNTALRQLAKSQLNNFYGKFSQNSNKTRTEFIRNQYKLDEILSKNTILNLTNLSDDVLQVEFEPPFTSPNRKSNIYIGAQVNAYSREIIYDYLMSIEKAGGVVYSVDVDGLFYSLPLSVQDPLPYSNVCGHFKNMFHENAEILAYYCLGTRNYSILYKDQDQNLKTIVKVKGLSLSSHCLDQKINANTYKNFIKSHFENEVQQIIIPQEKYCIDPNTKQMIKKFQNFTFQNELYIKRYVPVSYCQNKDYRIKTLPFGFKK